MPVAEMLQRTSSAEIAEWMAYDSFDPIGNERGDLQASIVASAVANGQMQKKDGSVFTPYDFMPYIERPEPPSAEEKLRAGLAHLVRKDK